MIKKFVNRIKDTQKIAREKNVHNWYNCVFHSIIIILGTSLVLSLYTIHFFGINLDTTLGELILEFQPGIFLPLFYSITLSYLFLEKLIILHILVFEKLNKTIFKLWQRMDMYWFKKYKKHSPVTEGLSKFQGKMAKFNASKSKRQKKLILLGIIIGLLFIQIGIRVPALMETVNEEPEIEEQTELQPTNPKQERSEIIIRGGG